MAAPWSPRTTIDPKSWLLTDGTIVDEPALEESPSGRKVRLAGTDLSAFTRDIDELLLKGVAAKAATMGAKPWMEIFPRNPFHFEATVGGCVAGAPSLHVLDGKVRASRSGETRLWWRFRHPSMPVGATIVIDLRTNWNNTYAVSSTLLMPSTVPLASPGVTNLGIEDNSFSDLGYYVGNTTKFREFLRDNPAPWMPDFVLGSNNFSNERAAVQDMLKRVRYIENLAQFEVPDLRDEEQPAWLMLDAYETNCNDVFLSSLAEYLDGAPSVELAVEHYNEMLKALRAVGMVLDGKDGNDFLRAMLAGDKTSLTVSVEALEAPGTKDSEHSLTVHLPSGTFVVNCDHRKAAKNEVAHAWEESLTMASLTGQEDALLAYARRYQETMNQRRADEILKARKSS